jgi:hypothetical protein
VGGSANVRRISRNTEHLLKKTKKHFDEAEIVYLTHATNAINSWNRINLAFGTIDGIASDRCDIRPGLSSALNLLSRIAPSLSLKVLNRRFERTLQSA